LEAPKFVGKALVSLSGAITYKLKQEETTGKYYFFVLSTVRNIEILKLLKLGKPGGRWEDNFKIYLKKWNESMG
jgi:hypothetical protein